MRSSSSARSGENVLTESNIRDLVKLLDEEMDGVAREQRERLETIEEELEDVKKRLGRIWQVIETTDIEMADASERIREHRERKEKLEIAAGEARALLSDRRQFLDSADTIAAFAADMSEFLKTSELTETKAFVRSFVKEIVVKPGRAAIVYSIPTPDDSPAGGCGRRGDRPKRGSYEFGTSWWAYFDDRQNRLRTVVGESAGLFLTVGTSSYGGSFSPCAPRSGLKRLIGVRDLGAMETRELHPLLSMSRPCHSGRRTWV